jgi:hypothetical protein
VLVRITGEPPLRPKLYELGRLRCNLCGEIFTASPPEGVGKEKYDATSAAMIGLLRYGSGLPFNRLEGLQAALGIPLAASTQWDIVREAALELEPVFEELIRQGANGDVLHNDDTRMRVLSLRNEPPEPGVGAERTGIFTSGIVSTGQGRRIALFFTGRKHAGENLTDVLTATALLAFVGDVVRFRSARRFASFIGLTPKERSTGNVRRLGGISKRGDVYLRMLLIHGARSVLWHAKREPSPDRLRAWALKLERLRGHNKAAVALANKLARISWAVLRHDRNFESKAA